MIEQSSDNSHSEHLGPARSYGTHSDGASSRTFTQDYGRFYDRREIVRMLQGGFRSRRCSATPTAMRSAIHEQGTALTYQASQLESRLVPLLGDRPDAKLIVVIPNMITDPCSPPSLGYSNSHIDRSISCLPPH